MFCVTFRSLAVPLASAWDGLPKRAFETARPLSSLRTGPGGPIFDKVEDIKMYNI